MLIVRLEIWPRGDARALRQIAALSITNVGAASDGEHLYEVRSEGRIAQCRHSRADGPLVLLSRALAALQTASEPDPAADNNAGDSADAGLFEERPRPATAASKERPRER
jgi:hypothetical protein